MIVKDISFDDPVDNILYDDVLLQLAEEGQSSDVIRFWESTSYFVVLGKIGKVGEDVQKTVLPVFRRSSGGGTVLQGKGCLNYTLVLNKESLTGLHDLKQSYALILGKVVEALKMLGVRAQYLPISDIALTENRKKISGNAQKRGRQYILHHGTLLYDFDLNLIESVLKMPKAMPEYREARTHLDFVSNIAVTDVDLKKVLMRVFNGAEKEAISSTEKELLSQMKKNKDITA